MFLFSVHESVYIEKRKVFFYIFIKHTSQNHQNNQNTTRIFTISENDIFYEISKLIKFDSFYNKK